MLCTACASADSLSGRARPSDLLLMSHASLAQALRRNPDPPQIPCHRVVASTLRLGGFGGSWVRSPSDS